MSVSVRWDRGAAPPPGHTRRALGTLTRRAVKAALRAEAADAELSVALVSDAAIAALNREWLEHDGPTDVISFPLYEDGEDPVGDVYIGVDQAVRQAAENGVDPAEEIVRLAIHGTLHVLGHDHPGPDRTGTAMWRLQERIVREVMV